MWQCPRQGTSPDFLSSSLWLPFCCLQTESLTSRSPREDSDLTPTSIAPQSRVRGHQRHHSYPIVSPAVRVLLAGVSHSLAHTVSSLNMGHLHMVCLSQHKHVRVHTCLAPTFTLMDTAHCAGFTKHFPIDCYPHQLQYLSPTMCQGVLWALPIHSLTCHSQRPGRMS